VILEIEFTAIFNLFGFQKTGLSSLNILERTSGDPNQGDSGYGPAQFVGTVD